MKDRSFGPEHSSLLDSLAMAASLNAAVRCWASHRARRVGMDPSLQESGTVAADRLRAISSGLRDVAVRVRLRRLLDVADAGTEADVIRRFEEHTLLFEGAEMLRTAHQSLLSLYPDVDESVVEMARHLSDAWRRAAQEGLTDLNSIDEAEELILRLRAQLERYGVS